MGKKSYSPLVASNQYVVGSFACIGGGLFGLDISSMSGVLNNPDWIRFFNNPQPHTTAITVAAMPLGSLFGALAVGTLADLLGRKYTISISGLFWIVGCIIQAASQNIGMLIGGRIIAGLAVGMASSTVPLYQAEITEPRLRGRMVSLQQWSITWGILIQYFIQFGCSYISGVASFRIPWSLQIIPAVILSVGMLWFPESPRWLVDNNRESEALEILADLHGKGDENNELVQLEFNEIKTQVYLERTEGAKSYLDLLRPGVFRRLSLGMAMQMWSQLSGMNIMMYYVVYVFEGAGLTGRRGNLIASSINYVLNMVLTIPAIIWIDKWGRRPMLLGGFLFMGTFLFLVGGLQGRFGHWGFSDGSTTQTWLVSGHDAATKGIIVASYITVCSFAISVGPVSWTYPSEIFAMRYRAKAVSLSTASNWVFNFALAYAVPPALSSISFKTYYIFGGFNFMAFLHVFFMFPETKGRTLEEIEDVFAQGHVFTAWKIKSDVGKKSLGEVLERERQIEGKIVGRDSSEHEKNSIV